MSVGQESAGKCSVFAALAFTVKSTLSSINTVFQRLASVSLHQLHCINYFSHASVSLHMMFLLLGMPFPDVLDALHEHREHSAHLCLEISQA